MSALLQSLPPFVSTLTLSLCSDIAMEHFESGTELVLSVLVERAFSLPELVREVRARAAAPLHLNAYIPRTRTEVSGCLVQEALMTLIQHGLVIVEAVSDSHLYQGNIPAILERLRLPQMTTLVKNSVSSAEAAFVFQEVARHGRLRRSEIPPSDAIDELLRLGFLAGGGPRSRPAAVESTTSAKAKAKAKSSRQKGASGTRTRRQQKAVDEETTNGPLEPVGLDELGGLKEVEALLSSRRGERSGGGMLTVDMESVQLKLLIEAAVETLTNRYGSESGKILRCVCERTLSASGGIVRAEWFTVESLMSWLRTEGRTKEDQVTRVLTMWTKTSSDFLRPWLMSRRADEDSQYRVDVSAVSASILEDLVCQTLLYRHGQGGLRIYNCLRQHGASDVASVSESCLIDREETQAGLAKLMADGFVIVGSAGGAGAGVTGSGGAGVGGGSSHSAWVYGVEGNKVVAATLSVLERTTLNLRRRLRTEVFLQTSMEDRAVTFSDEERLYLDKVIAAQDVLEAKLVQVGSAIALLRHALSLI